MEYNQKVRVHGNGLVEIRLYEKAVEVGKVSKPKKRKQTYEKQANPFVEGGLKMQKESDADGWTKEYERDAISVAKSVKRTKDAIFDYSNAVEWEWFCTFTFDGEKVDRKDFDAVVSKMSKWLNNMRSRYCPDMQYVLVPEKHEDGAWHFHGVFRNCDGLNFVPAKNLQKTYKGSANKYYMQDLVRKGEQVYDMERFKLGFTDCTRVRDTKKVANYILKYITKDMVTDTPNKRRYWCSKNLPKPKETVELVDIDFESYRDYTFAKCIEKNPETYGHTFEVQHGDFTNRISYIYT